MMMGDTCKCGRRLIITLTPHLVHYARLDCPIDGFIGWIKNPETSANRKNINCPYTRCGFCCREINELGIKETVECDHMVPLELGGKDDMSNIIPLCTSCHKLKNWATTYMNKHMKMSNDNGNKPDNTEAIRFP